MNNAEMGHMPEANFSPEAQPITPEISTLNQEGIVVFEQSSKPSTGWDRLKIGFHNAVDRVKTVAKRYGAVPAVGAIALVAVACNGGDKKDITIDTQISTPTAGASLEPTPRTTPTLSPTLAPSSGGGSEGKFPTPTATSTPEVKQEVNCGIMSSEACASGEYIQWVVFSDAPKVIGMGFVLKPGEELRFPEGLQVATSVYPETHTYNGTRITGVSKDGRRLSFIGSVTPAEKLSDSGKDMPAGVVGTVNSSAPVLDGSPYNIVFISSEEDIRSRFPDKTINPPKIVNSTPIAAAAAGPGQTFIGVKPPSPQQ